MYEWSNWVFVCRLCNRNKSNRSPAEVYVDPRAEWADERPERHFAFDTAAGALIPKGDHLAKRCQRAGLMIRDLNLNAFYHLKIARTCWTSSTSRSAAATKIQTHSPASPGQYWKSVAWKSVASR